jgi:Rps23 Pro-64 3,4-dihydroxylase Tpa1-like proline 4-hydroxylase
MEAALAGKPVISFIPEKDDDLVAWLPIQLSKQVLDSGSLSAALNKVFKEDYSNPITKEIDDIWKRNVANVEKFSSKLISDEINNTVAFSQEKPCSRHFVLQVLLQRIKCSLKFVKDTYLVKTQSITRDKFGKLDRKEVFEKMALFNAIHGENMKYRVSFKGYDVIEITRR